MGGSIFNLLWTIASYFLYVVLVVGTIIIIVLDNRNPVRTIAWILVLVFLPIVGLILYFFFGRNVRREKIINKKSFNKLLHKPVAEYMSQDTTETFPAYNNLINYYKRTEESYPYSGNAVDIYTDGYAMLQSLLRDLTNAKKYIHVEYYIFNNDAVGQMVCDALIERAKAGVEVRVIYDDVGNWYVPNRFYEQLLEAGVEVRSFLKVRFPLFTSRINYRNHRKVVVIDGQLGYIGGMNLADRYLKGNGTGIWRDTHIKIRGKAVHGLQTCFLLDWYFVDRTLITSSRYFEPIDDQGSSVIQIVTSAPIGPWRTILQGLTQAILSARKYFFIQTPYFLPTDDLLSALQTAALAGVDIRIMLPAKSDSRLAKLACYSYLNFVLETGVKIYFYNKGFLHSKMMVSDDLFSTVGSTNVDFRSFEHNFEINAFIYDRDTALKMREIFVDDQRESTQLYLSNWKKRKKTQRAAESLARLISPLL